MGPPIVPSPMNPTRSLIDASPFVHDPRTHGTAIRSMVRVDARAPSRHNRAMDETQALLGRLLRGAPSVIDVGDDIAAWWRAFRASETLSLSPFDRAVLAGFRANRVAGAFA